VRPGPYSSTTASSPPQARPPRSSTLTSKPFTRKPRSRPGLGVPFGPAAPPARREVEITAGCGCSGRTAARWRWPGAGGPFAVELDYRAHAECVEPLFGINIFGATAFSRCAPTPRPRGSATWNLPRTPDPGDHPGRILAGHTGTARFEAAPLPLLAGDYELSVNVYRGRSGAHVAVDEVLGVERFKVVNGDHVDLGLCLCPGKWKIS